MIPSTPLRAALVGLLGLGSLAVGLGGCVLDRTGQSATAGIQRELAVHNARIQNVEAGFDSLDARVAQLEELTRNRGQEEILRMETLEQVRQEVARLRGDLEVLQHESDQLSLDAFARSEDATFRLVWLETRAAQLEKAMGIQPPPPPSTEELAAARGEDEETPAEGGDTAASDGGEGTGEGEEVPDEGADLTDPDALISLAEEHLAAGRDKAAIAVLNRFLEQHPDHGRAAEALYRRAEAYFNGGAHQSAVIRFQEVIDRHKDSAWASWAMLRQGECFDAQGQPDNARLFYEDVVRMWPKSKAAKEAAAKLK